VHRGSPSKSTLLKSSRRTILHAMASENLQSEDREGTRIKGAHNVIQSSRRHTRCYHTACFARLVCISTSPGTKKSYCRPLRYTCASSAQERPKTRKLVSRRLESRRLESRRLKSKRLKSRSARRSHLLALRAPTAPLADRARQLEPITLQNQPRWRFGVTTIHRLDTVATERPYLRTVSDTEPATTTQPRSALPRKESRTNPQATLCVLLPLLTRSIELVSPKLGTPRLFWLIISWKPGHHQRDPPQGLGPPRRERWQRHVQRRDSQVPRAPPYG
jgi:hypothetical protein